jgi:Family of unknown function (DUF6064)
MSEWWTYSLSDFLLFSPRTYYRLFELYNLAVWPWHLLVIVLGLAVLLLWLRGGAWQGRTVAVILASCWLFVAWAYLLVRYDTINWAASYFAGAFAVEALLLVWTPRRGRRGRTLHLCICAVRLATGRPAARSAVAADRDLRRCAGSHRGGDARRSHCGRSHALEASRRAAALVRDHRCDLVGHAIAGCLAGAGRCPAGVCSSLLQDALAASTNFAGLSCWD